MTSRERRLLLPVQRVEWKGDSNKENATMVCRHVAERDRSCVPRVEILA